jgi:hypothetical protein
MEITVINNGSNFGYRIYKKGLSFCSPKQKAGGMPARFNPVQARKNVPESGRK